MKRIHLPRLGLLALALALQTGVTVAAPAAPAAPATAAGTTEQIKLNMVPLPASRQQIDTTMNSRLTMTLQLPADASEQMRAGAAELQKLMPLRMTTVMRQTLTTTALDKDGAYQLDADAVTLKSEMRNAAGQPQTVPKAPTVSMTATIKDDQIESTAIKTGELSPEEAQVMSKEAREQLYKQAFDWLTKFNGVPMKVGESVEMPLDLALPTGPRGFNGRLLAKYTLVSINKGVASFDINVRMDMNVTAPSSTASEASSAGAAAAAAALAETKATMTGSGKMDLRLADRLTLRNTMTMRVGMDLEPQPGQKMRMDMEMDMVGVGKTLPAAKKAPASPAKPATKG